MKRALTPQDFERLRAHLSRLDEPVKRFCQDYGFSERTTGLGRYPRRRVCRYGKVNLYIDLQMDLDPEGEFFHEFNLELPYSMGGGVWIDVDQTRYSIAFPCFNGLPFSELERSFWSRLVECYGKLETVTFEYLIEKGEKSPVSENP